MANLVLAGPMLRRADRDQVAVFVALRAPAQVRLTVLRENVEVLSGSTSTVPLGAQLHVAVVTARAAAGEQPLAWGQVYAYDLAFEVGDGWRGLYEAGVLFADPAAADDLVRLRYSPYERPTFRLPAEAQADWRVLHGSCRKPHGPGGDALVKADQILLDTLDTTERPQQLFLTGDQIYADDVAPKLLRLIQPLCHDLVDPGDAELKKLQNDTHASLMPGERGRVAKQAGLTSRHADSHLLTRGEYMVMYLLAWSDALWPEGALADESLEDFVACLPRVRRALANISTYMIFDDHEVTDDWNIRRRWVKKVNASSLGRRILTNGLAAYAVFQHWGNAPERFENGSVGHEILDWLVTSDHVDRAPPEVEAALGLPGVEGARLEYGYRVPGPICDTVVLDTRARREFPPRRGYSLMSQADIRAALPATSKPFTMVISAAPVLGVRLIEWWQQFLAALALETLVDAESWHDARTFAFLIERLAERKRVIVLSGDVHYAFTATLDGKPPTQGARIVGLVSSALKNATAGVGVLGGGGVESVVTAAPPKRATSNVTIGGQRFEAELLMGPPSNTEGTNMLDAAGQPRRRTPLQGRSNLGDVSLRDGHVQHRIWILDQEGDYSIVHRPPFSLEQG